MTIGTYLKILLHGVAIGYAYHDEINEVVEAGAKVGIKVGKKVAVGLKELHKKIQDVVAPPSGIGTKESGA